MSTPIDSHAGDVHWTPAVDTRAMIAGVTLSVVGIGTFLLMPQFVEAVVTDLHYSERQAGWISSVVMAGSTLAAAASSGWIRRTSWRTAATAALVGLLVANGASMLAHTLIPFIALQGLVGFCGGSLYSLSLTILSDGRRPDRYFAYAIGAQTIYQVFGLVAGPPLIRHGANAMLALFAALCIAGLLVVAFVPARGRVANAGLPGTALINRPVLLALAGCFVFYINIGAYWTYIERIGTTAGIGISAISNSLAFSAVASLAGVALASWLGDRRGFLLPIAVSALAIVVSMVLLTGALQLPAYLGSAIIYGIAWNLSMTFQYSTVNVVDRSGRGVALAPALHWAGGAAGPAIAALVVTEQDHSGVLWLVAATVTLSLGCFMAALRSRPRASAVRTAGSSNVAS